MDIITPRRTFISSIVITTLAGCVDSPDSTENSEKNDADEEEAPPANGDGESDSDSSDDLADNLFLTAHIVDEVPENASTVETDDNNKITETDLFKELFQSYEDEEASTVETEVGDAGFLMTESVDPNSEEGRAAEDVFEELPYSEPEEGLDGVYIVHDNKAFVVEIEIEQLE